MTKPLDDMPFDALISVRYRAQGRLGQWIDKEAIKLATEQDRKFKKNSVVIDKQEVPSFCIG